MTSWEDEAVARIAAEESEAQALSALRAHADVALRIQLKQQEKVALERRMVAVGELAAAAGGSPEKKQQQQQQQTNGKHKQHTSEGAKQEAGQDEDDARALAGERAQVHPAMQKAIKAGRSELRKAEGELKVARHHVAQKVTNHAHGLEGG